MEEAINEILTMIENKTLYTITGPTEVDGYKQIGGTVYSERFYECISQITNELGKAYPDYKYGKHINKILNKPTSKLKKPHIATYITWLFRGERVNDGFIAQEVDSGRFKEFLQRLKELK